MSESMVDRVAKVIAARISSVVGYRVKADDFGTRPIARAVIEAMREPENYMLAAGYDAMFADKWDGTQAPMMGAGWEAMIDTALGEQS